MQATIAAAAKFPEIELKPESYSLREDGAYIPLDARFSRTARGPQPGGRGEAAVPIHPHLPGNFVRRETLSSSQIPS